MHETNAKEARNIGLALVLGLAIGFAVYYTKTYDYLAYLKPIGDIFVRCLKMVIVPLVFSSIFMAMINLGTPEKLGSMGKKAMLYYFATTAIAVFFGLVFVNLIQPGIGADLANAGLSELSAGMQNKVTGNEGLWGTIIGVIVNAIPTNPFAAMANTNVLQLIVFALMIGMVALHHPKKTKSIIDFMDGLEDLSLELTHLIMKFAPVGIFVLMADVIAKSGLSAIYSLSKYMVTVVLGLGFHAVFLMAVATWRLKKSPVFILKGLSSALFTAFSTSSSAATLPITMASVEENLGVKKETAKFVLPLGATVNMDGTALYESVAAIFIAQAYGIDLSIGQQIIIFMTASLAAVGAAAIPGAGLITMGIVLTTVKLPLEGIGLILAVDRILDMFRTTVNVFGDCVGTIFVDSLEKEKE